LAGARLRVRAARIDDAALRDVYLTAVPENARTLALAVELGTER
jgi:hypothetical protein